MPILRATLDHLAQLTPLFDAYRVFYQLPSDPGAGQAFLQERLLKDDSVIYLALDASTSSSALGFAQLYPSFSSLSMQPVWILNDLFVRPDARQQGVASGLIEQCRKLAQTSGAKGLQLETGRNNQTAQRLYEKIGFQRVEDYFYFLPVYAS